MSDVESRLTVALGRWAAGSVAAGALLSVPRPTRGFGRQTLARRRERRAGAGRVPAGALTRSGLDAVRVDSVPLLVVEVLSRGTRSRDQVTKRRVYEQAGEASYWIVDAGQPSLTVLELQGGGYVARVAEDQAWTARQPSAVTVVPADLLR